MDCRLEAVAGLLVFAEIEAHPLVIGGHAQTDRSVDQLEQYQAADEGKASGPFV